MIIRPNTAWLPELAIDATIPCIYTGVNRPRRPQNKKPATSTLWTSRVKTCVAGKKYDVILMLVLHLSDVYGAGFMRGRRGFHFVDVAGTQNLTWGHRFLPAMSTMCNVAGFLFCGRRGRLTPVSSGRSSDLGKCKVNRSGYVQWAQSVQSDCSCLWQSVIGPGASDYNPDCGTERTPVWLNFLCSPGPWYKIQIKHIPQLLPNIRPFGQPERMLVKGRTPIALGLNSLWLGTSRCQAFEQINLKGSKINRT